MIDSEPAPARRLAALDVHYHAAGAKAAAVLFADWDAEEPIETALFESGAPAETYEPGALYKRELPALLAVLTRLSLRPTMVIVDAFAHLGPERRPGLGWRLWEALGETTPVIGVAKNAYDGAPAETAVLRGDSARPLFVTAVGVDEALARDWIRAMHGPHRLPSLLKLADRLSRGGDA